MRWEAWGLTVSKVYARSISITLPGPEQGRRVVLRGRDGVEEQGTEAAFDRLMDPRGGFIRGDLYVFVLDPEGKVVAEITWQQTRRVKQKQKAE